MPSRIQLRRDTSANWAAANPVLALAEPGLETDTNLIKYGDGVTAWNSLPYAGVSPNVSGNLIPTANGVYNLGSADYRWNDLYLTGNTIYIGNVSLSEADGALVVTAPNGTVTDLSTSLVDRGADTNNWNNLTQMGIYTVNRTSWAGVTGAPLDCTIFVGVLEVLRTTNGTDVVVTQMFYPGEQQADVTVQFNRSYWNGVWTNWYKVLNDSQTVVGGTF